MGLFRKRQTQQDKDTARLLAKLDGRVVKYVTERDPETRVETVIGHSGSINTKDGRIVIVCDGKEVFRCSTDNVQCGELMSLEGAIIEGTSAQTGKNTMVVAYYKYYR